MVEAAAPGAGRVHEEAVEDLPTRLVGVEALIHEMPEEAPGLRNAETEAAMDREGTCRVVLRVRHHVADRGKPETDDDGVARTVHELVDPAGLEAAGLRDARVLIHEAPLRARHDAPWAEPTITFGQYVVRVIGADHRIRPVVAVSQRQRGDALVDGPVAPDQPVDRAAGLGDDGRVEFKDAVATRHVELPPDPDQ